MTARSQVQDALASRSPGGAALTDAERAAIRQAMERLHPTTGGVAGMPLDELSRLNLDALARELSGGREGFVPPAGQ